MQLIDTEKDLTVYLYGAIAIRLHCTVMRKELGKVTIRMDASGSMVRNFNGKQVLCYLLIGEAGGQHNIGEMITRGLTQASPGDFLSHLMTVVYDTPKLDETILFYIAVCDFSLARIDGYLSGICSLSPIDYIIECQKILVGDTDEFLKVAIFICATHLIVKCWTLHYMGLQDYLSAPQ